VRPFGGDRRFGFLDRGQVLKRLDHADHRAVGVADHVGVDREVDAHAARQVAPVLRLQAVGAAAVALVGVERGDLGRLALEREIGETGACGEIEALPMVLGADDLRRFEPSQPCAGVVPHRDPAVAVENEGRHRHFVDDAACVAAEVGPAAVRIAPRRRRIAANGLVKRAGTMFGVLAEPDRRNATLLRSATARSGAASTTPLRSLRTTPAVRRGRRGELDA